MLLTTTLHRKLRSNEIATATMLIVAVVRDSVCVRKRVGKCRKHFDEWSLHIPMKTMVNRLIGRGGGVTIGKKKRGDRKLVVCKILPVDSPLGMIIVKERSNF